MRSCDYNMPRKGENIHKRKDGRWEARYIKGYGKDGKAVYGYVFGKSYLEAKRKRQENAVLPLYSLLLPTTVGTPLHAVTQVIQAGGNVNVYSANTANNINNVLVMYRATDAAETTEESEN